MFWIIQSQIWNEPFYDKLISFLDRCEIPYELVKAVPFSGEMIPEPTIPDGMNVMVIGSYSLANAAIEKGWIPGAFNNENYDYRVWSKAWKGHCFNAPAHVCRFEDVPFQQNPFFIRPALDTKDFTGQVMDWGEFQEWQHKVLNLKETYTSMDGDTVVMVAKPKPIEAEFRFIVVDGKVITGSMYKQGSTVLYKEVDPKIEYELWDFTTDRVAEWQPARAFALDICRSNGEYFVLEMGCMNAASLYHCDVQKIVMAIEDMRF